MRLTMVLGDGEMEMEMGMVTQMEMEAKTHHCIIIIYRVFIYILHAVHRDD